MRGPLNTNKGNERSSIANADDVRACVLGEGVWLVFFKVKINLKKWEIWKKKKVIYFYIYWPRGQGTHSSKKLPASQYKQAQNCRPCCCVHPSNTSDRPFYSGLSPTVSPLSALLLCWKWCFGTIVQDKNIKLKFRGRYEWTIGELWRQ